VTAATRSAVALAILLLLAGCGSPARKRVPFDYGAYIASDPRSVLVAPVVPVVQERRASRFFLATITEPLAERGYYVFPVRMSLELEKLAGFTGRAPEDYSGERLEERAAELAALFGTDSVLFVRIVEWDYRIKGLGEAIENPVDPVGTHTVAMEYHLTDDRGKTLWRAKQQIALQKGGGNIFTEIWNFFASPLHPEVGLAREANRTVIEGQRHKKGRRTYYPVDPMLVGSYHPRYERDRARRRGTSSP